MIKDKDKLIYDLIFSAQSEFEIEISEYIEDIYKYDRFIKEIKSVLKKSKVMIIQDSIDLSSNSAIWKLKVKK